MSWFLNLKVFQKIVFLVILMIFFIGCVGGVGYYYNNHTSEEMNTMYKDRLLPVSWLSKVIQYSLDNKALLYIMQLKAANKEDVTPIINQVKANAEEINKNFTLYENSSLDPFEVETVKKVKTFMGTYRAERTKIIDALTSGNMTNIDKLYASVEVEKDKYFKEVFNLIKYNEETAAKSSAKATQDSQFAMIVIIAAIFASLVFALGVGLLIANLISKPLQLAVKNILEVADGNLNIEKLDIKSKDEVGKLVDALNKMTDNLRKLVLEVKKSVEDISSDAEEMNAAADQTAQGATQVATSVGQMADGASQISNSVTQLADGAQKISSSVVQLAAGAKDISSNVDIGAKNINKMNNVIQKVSHEANNIALLTSNTEQNANEGSQHVKKAVDKIGSIKNVATEISGTINDLGKLGAEIEQIVDLIKGIASQTNLLALNAAIEAARAGEHGKGFAVVAEEVKKLAGQSADATDKITTMIKDIQNKTNTAVNIMDKAVHEVDEGVMIINDAGSALENIIDKVKEANNNIQVVTKEIDDVAKNSEGIVKMIDKIAQITEKTTANAEEIAAITEQTAASAEEISSIAEQSAANTEEISSVVEEQNASLEEINESSQSLVQTVQGLQEVISAFKVDNEATFKHNFVEEKSKVSHKAKAPKLQPGFQH